MKARLFVETNVFLVLVSLKSILLLNKKNLTQTIDSSEVFERWKLQKQPKRINKTTNGWEETTITYLQQDCPEQVHDFISWLLSSETIILE